MSLAWQGFELTSSDEGRTVSLSRDRRPWFDLTLDGVSAATEARVEDDELAHLFGGSPLVEARHTLAENWTMRWVAAGEDEAALFVRAAVGPATCCWVWAAGAEARIAVAPLFEAGPVLAIRLVNGHLADDDGRWRLTAPGPNAVGRRRVTTLRAEVVDSWASFAATFPSWLPPLALATGQPLELDAPDWGMVLPPSATSRSGPAGVEVDLAPGVHHINLHSPRGVTDLAVAVAPTLPSLLAPAAARVVLAGGPTSGAEAVLVAEAAARRLVRLSEEDLRRIHDVVPAPEDLLGIAALVGQGPTFGGATAVRVAFELLASAPVRLGYGRVVMRAWLAGLAEGLDLHADALALLRRPAESELAAFELSLLGLRSAEGAAAAVAGLVHALGGWLPGSPLGLTGPVRAHLAALLRLCPEEWPAAREASETALKTERRLLAELVAAPDPATLAWLVLADALA